MTREIEWLPEELMDEVVPPARPAPNDWRQRVDGGWGLIVREDFEDEPRTRPLADGEIVEFCWLEHHGFGVLTITEDGWTAVPPKPADANCASVAGEGIADTVAGLVDEMREALGSDAHGTHRVVYYTWSEPMPFVFEAATGEFRAAGFDPADPPVTLRAAGHG